MTAPEFNWIANPDIVTAAIQSLAGAVIVTGAALISVVIWVFNKTDAKVDRIATSLEALTLTVTKDIATIQTQCKANHPS